jgi:hypothetical protein
MTTKEQNCRERIASELANTEEQLKELYSRLESGDDVANEEASIELNELPLGISTAQFTVITLAYGGPAEYIEVTHDGFDIIRAVYRFSDWYDTATLELDDTSPLYRYAQEIIEVEEANR